MEYLRLFNFRRFFTILVITTPVSFLTFLIVQALQGRVENFYSLAGKAALIGLGLGIMFALPERKKNYPWM